MIMCWSLVFVGRAHALHAWNLGNRQYYYECNGFGSDNSSYTNCSGTLDASDMDPHERNDCLLESCANCGGYKTEDIILEELDNGEKLGTQSSPSSTTTDIKSPPDKKAPSSK